MLKGIEKAAAVLSLLGDELSHKVLGYLPEEAAVAIISASENLKTPTRESLVQVVNEFNDIMAKAPEKTEQPQYPAEQPQTVGEPGSPLEKISKASPAQLAQALSGERVEISAYVLSHLPLEKIYEILSMLKDTREQVENRLMSIKDVPIAKELQEKILKGVAERLS